MQPDDRPCTGIGRCELEVLAITLIKTGDWVLMSEERPASEVCPCTCSQTKALIVVLIPVLLDLLEDPKATLRAAAVSSSLHGEGLKTALSLWRQIDIIYPITFHWDACFKSRPFK